jgi:hypothetical protein
MRWGKVGTLLLQVFAFRNPTLFGILSFDSTLHSSTIDRLLMRLSL